MKTNAVGRARRLRRRAALTGAGAICTLLGAGGGTAWAGALLPERGGSRNADDIASLYTIVLVLAGIVFAGVTIALVWSLWRYRESRSPVAAQIRGHTRLEIGWTLAAAALIVFIAIISLAKIHVIETPDPAAASPAAVSAGVVPAGHDKSLHIDVVGRQYIWMYKYPGGAYSYGEMVAPVGVTVELNISSVDVAHSWWIPKLGGKVDAIPGYTSHTWFRLYRPGLFNGQCAELCGRNHANMLAQVRGVTPAEYASWLARQKRLIAAADAQDARDRKSASANPEGGA